MEVNNRETTSSSDNDDSLEDSFDFKNSPFSVPLIPFTNQVGGHEPFLRFSENAVCKPMNAREKDFYESVEKYNPSFKDFLPIYLGVVNVTYPAKKSTESTPSSKVRPPYTPEVILEKNRHIFDKLKMSTKKYEHKRSKSSDSSSSNKSPRRLKEQRSNSFHIKNEMPQSNDNNDEVKAPFNSPSKVNSDEFQLKVFREALSPSVRNSWESCYQSSIKGMKELTLEEQDENKNEAEDVVKPKSNSIAIKVNQNEDNRKQESASCPEPDSLLGRMGRNFQNPWSKNVANKVYRESCDDSDTSLKQPNDSKFILLEDLTKGLKYPCILDLKMGTRQYGIEATPKKRESQIKKAASTTSATLGVRVCGMQVYQINTQTFFFQDKYDGRNLNIEQFKKTLAKYLNNGRTMLTHFIPTIISKLKLLLSHVETMNQYRLYSSSLLLLYDGFFEEDYEKEDTFETEFQAESSTLNIPGHSYAAPNKPLKLKKALPIELYKQRNLELRIIDFAHSISPLNYEASIKIEPQTSLTDDGYIFGINNLIECFTEIFEEHKLASNPPL